jgi:hypothetical protein
MDAHLDAGTSLASLVALPGKTGKEARAIVSDADNLKTARLMAGGDFTQAFVNVRARLSAATANKLREIEASEANDEHGVRRVLGARASWLKLRDAILKLPQTSSKGNETSAAKALAYWTELENMGADIRAKREAENAKRKAEAEAEKLALTNPAPVLAD